MSAPTRFLLAAVLLLSLVVLCLGQTNLVQNPSFETPLSPYWYTPLGTFDSEAGENRTTLGRSSNLTTIAGPGGFSYDGLHSALFEGGSTLQAIQQTIPVTAGHQYILSFFLMFAAGDTIEGFQAAYQFNTQGSQTTLMTNANFPVQPPFWWTQFTFNLNSGSSDSAVNVTFYGRDPDYGFLLDYVTLYDAGTTGSPTSVTAPPGPPALVPNPSNNQLVNGDFESGSTAPWRMPSGDNPFPINSSIGSYDFTAKNGADGCPQGLYCFVFGAPYSSLPLTQTLPIYRSNNYTLSFNVRHSRGLQQHHQPSGGRLTVRCQLLVGLGRLHRHHQGSQPDDRHCRNNPSRTRHSRLCHHHPTAELPSCWRHHPEPSY